MATEAKKLEQTVKRVKRKTPEMEALLGIGYNLTVEQAKQIIAEREKNPATHSYERYNEAKAFLEAYETDPIPVSNRAGWKRTKTR